jgi:hypothetical protein
MIHEAAVKKLPWFPFEPVAWLGDPALRRASLAARGLWIDCLCLMHEGEPYGYLAQDGVALTDKQIANSLGTYPQTVRKTLCELEGLKVLSRDQTGVFSRRMVHDHQVRQARAAGGVKSLEHPTVQARIQARKDTLKDTHDSTVKSIEVRGKSKEKRVTTTTSQPAVVDTSGMRSWLGPIAEAWEAKNGPGSFAWGRYTKALKPLFGKLEASDVAMRLTNYLAATEGEYVSIERFVQTNGQHVAAPKSKSLAFADWIGDTPDVGPNGRMSDKWDLCTNPDRELEWKRVKRELNIVEKSDRVGAA